MPPGSARPQRYVFGWLVAVGGLSNLGNPALTEGWGTLLGTGGAPLAGVVTAWSVVVGLAAAAVRPWSWYVLLGCHALGLLWIASYVAFRAAAWHDVAIAAGLGLLYTGLSFVYFYRRRAMFGAGGRWRALERLWPGIRGPETVCPESSLGFAGLPLRLKLLVVVVVILLVMIGRA